VEPSQSLGAQFAKGQEEGHSNPRATSDPFFKGKKKRIHKKKKKKKRECGFYDFGRQGSVRYGSGEEKPIAFKVVKVDPQVTLYHYF